MIYRQIEYRQFRRFVAREFDWTSVLNSCGYFRHPVFHELIVFPLSATARIDQWGEIAWDVTVEYREAFPFCFMYDDDPTVTQIDERNLPPAGEFLPRDWKEITSEDEPWLST